MEHHLWRNGMYIVTPSLPQKFTSGHHLWANRVHIRTSSLVQKLTITIVTFTIIITSGHHLWHKRMHIRTSSSKQKQTHWSNVSSTGIYIVTPYCTKNVHRDIILETTSSSKQNKHIGTLYLAHRNVHRDTILVKKRMYIGTQDVHRDTIFRPRGGTSGHHF